MSFEKCFERLPQLSRRTNPFADGKSSYALACCRIFEEDITKDSLSQLLAAISQHYRVGPIAESVAEYLVYSEGTKEVTAPFKVSGAAQCLSIVQTLYEVCGVEKFNGRERLFPAFDLGHDKNGTHFYLFISDSIRGVGAEEHKHDQITGLGGAVLSLTDEDLKQVAHKCAESSESFSEFVYKLADEGCCCPSVEHFIRFCFDLCDAHVLTSPCKDGQEDEVRQCIKNMFGASQQNVKEEDLYKRAKFSFLVTLLDE